MRGTDGHYRVHVTLPVHAQRWKGCGQRSNGFSRNTLTFQAITDIPVYITQHARRNKGGISQEHARANTDIPVYITWY